MTRRVLLTGACGFLGTHIIRLLQSKRPDYALRVYDMAADLPAEFRNTTPPIEYMRGDINDEEAVLEACRGVDLVIHLCAIVPFWLFSNEQLKHVNYGGTVNVLNACKETGVRRLLFTSSLSTVIPCEGIVEGDEDSPYLESGKYLYGYYAETKTMAEQAVLSANGAKVGRTRGAVLTTCAVRCLAMFGEGDPYQVPGILSASFFGVAPRVGNGSSQCHAIYVVNVAWAHVLAADKLLADDPVVAGQIYMPIDDTPVMNYFDLVGPLVAPLNYKLLERPYIPYRFAWVLGLVSEIVCKTLNPIVRIPMVVNCTSFNILCISGTFKTKKACRDLGFQPLYSYEEAKCRSIEYLMDTFEPYRFCGPLLKGQKSNSRIWLMLGVSVVVALLAYLVLVLQMAPSAAFWEYFLGQLKTLRYFPIALVGAHESDVV
eukprot:NODE_1913_length_1564_cov_130.963914_g1820_i0.p1 GENE.NODE_1913_length_1564_cov_130.963914_g1820_i0~~NODE_1913_length_1564_cov_130.963914_g1820_i0.p1  ORF type:complete len:447 (+),score=77.92 NODE_1913_length_1564_cov_130.963914_g1820_i0:52-1341(+)